MLKISYNIESLNYLKYQNKERAGFKLALSPYFGVFLRL